MYIVIIEKYTYDHADRLLTQTHQTDSNPAERIADNTYDLLGQLVKKTVGGKTTLPALQTVDYAYNIRGWLKTINDVNNLGSNDLFAFKLGYNEGSNPLYNGNIALTQWKTKNTDSSLKTYNYTYDALNRILTATDNTTKFNLTGLSYDKNGNIMGLIRQGQVIENPNLALNAGYGQMDNLVYTYDPGNKLLKVTDNANDTYGFKDGTNIGDDFTYDQNGNMLTDANKGITSIVYNHLNLPTQVFINNSQHIGNISYIYDASGVKLKKITTEGSSLITTEYAGAFVYENGVLQFLNTAEGYAEPTTAGAFKYVYQYKDHLGNIRLSYKDISTTSTPNLQILEENNYYPFGLKHKGYNNTQNGRDHKYGFGNKEEQNELGLGWIDITARNYDAALGRWMNPDALAEKYYDQSTYTYAINNPVIYIDPDGNAVEICCDAAKAFLLTVVDNAVGSNLRNKYDTGTQDYRSGKIAGHSASLAISVITTIEGAGMTAAGGTGLAASGVAAATGVGAPVGGVGAVASGATMAAGAVATAVGVNMMGNTVDNMKADAESDGNTTSSSQKTTTKQTTKENSKVKTENELEASQNQFEGIEKAQSAAKKEVKGQKQNKINDITKSKQREKNAFKRIDLDDLD